MTFSMNEPHGSGIVRREKPHEFEQDLPQEPGVESGTFCIRNMYLAAPSLPHRRLDLCYGYLKRSDRTKTETHNINKPNINVLMWHFIYYYCSNIHILLYSILPFKQPFIQTLQSRWTSVTQLSTTMLFWYLNAWFHSSPPYNKLPLPATKVFPLQNLPLCFYKPLWPHIT